MFLLRALCVVWTTPLVATLGMSLTIPLAMVADMVIHGRHYSAIYILGSIQVMYYFKPASDLRISLKLRGKKHLSYLSWIWIWKCISILFFLQDLIWWEQLIPQLLFPWIYSNHVSQSHRWTRAFCNFQWNGLTALHGIAFYQELKLFSVAFGVTVHFTNLMAFGAAAGVCRICNS